MNAKASVSKELNTKHTKILEGLLKLPVNKQCADCKSKGPRWASINLGIFICLQCSGIHRSLGVHISQVRSATLDTWLPEQVAFMQKMGNEKANNYWEAELPPNYARNGIESFIHSKYKEKRWVPRDEKSTSSPPPKVEEEEEEEEEEEVSFENNLGNHDTKKDHHNHAPKIPTVAPSVEGLHALDDPSGKGSLSASRSNNGWVVFQSKEPRSAPEKKGTAAVAKIRNKSTGSTSSLKPSTQRTTHTAGAPNDQMSFFDKHIMSAPPLPFHQQQAHPSHHQDHPEPVCVPTHKRSASDSYAMNGTITPQSWVNFDYDDPEDRPPVGQWYSSGSSQQAENFTLPHQGASDDSLPAFRPNACESFMSANGTLGDASGVMRPRDCSSSFATNSRSLSEYDLSSLSQGLTG